MAYHSYSAAFGNLVFRNEKERLEKCCPTKTVSIWSYIQATKERFFNPLYHPKKKSLHLHYKEKELRVWREYFGTLDEVLKKEVPPNKLQEGIFEDILMTELLRLKAENEELKSKVASQMGELLELNRNHSPKIEIQNGIDVESDDSEEEASLLRKPQPSNPEATIQAQEKQHITRNSSNESNEGIRPKIHSN